MRPSFLHLELMKKLVSPFLLLSALSQGSTNDANKVNKKALDPLNEHWLCCKTRNLNPPFPYFRNLLKLSKVLQMPFFRWAVFTAELKDYKKAVEYFEKARAIDPAHFLYNLPYSINLAGMGRFQDALAAINVFLTSLPN